jgi:transposase
MAGFFENISPDQTTLFPERLDDQTQEVAVVRVVDLLVDRHDLSAPGFQRYAGARTGRPRFHAAALPKLFKDGNLKRIPSSRRLENETGRNVELMWAILIDLIGAHGDHARSEDVTVFFQPLNRHEDQKCNKLAES